MTQMEYLETTTTVSVMKTILDGINSILDVVEEKRVNFQI